MNRMFSDVVATGEDSWGPSLGSLPVYMENVDREEQILEDDMETQAFGHEEVGGNTSTTIGNASTSSGKRKKIRKNKGVAISYMRELRESALAMKPPPVATIKEAVELISSIPEMRSDLDLYCFAVNYIRDKDSREIFMSIPDELRVWWIKKCL
ncbi:hypothetical protein KSP39_PZI010596 [Platanthera zijinensis]|uniref:Uncharacterized protein n=1 Tax=Platanthera zijinensis TaxID=2320716 RepID=A0AAP0BIY6_9ASPA